jgi:hypothetical protein
MSELLDIDDYLHEASNHERWRESFYFNFVDLEAGVCGFSTIGILPNEAKREFVFALFVDDNPEFYFTEPKGPIPTDISTVLSDDTLSYKLVKPFQDWRIEFNGPRLTAEIQWQQRFPAYDFGPGSGTSWGRHLEQSGYINGSIFYPDGRRRRFSGFGQRDKSWGVRDWHIDEWFALHAQFKEFMIGLRCDTIDGQKHLSGCVSSAEGNIPLVDIEVETKFEDRDIRKPVRAVTQVTDAKGRVYTLRSRLVNPVTFARFSRRFLGGETVLFEEMVIHESEELGETGTGLAEWLFTYPKGGSMD